MNKIICVINKARLMIEQKNPYKLAEAIETLIKDKELRMRLGENGRKAVLEKYNWENESKKLIGLYQKLLAKEERKKSRQDADKKNIRI